MNNKERIDLAHWVVTLAKKHGASEAAVNISNSRDVEVSFRDKQLDKLKESTKSSLNITIYADGKYSSHSTNDLRKSELGKFVEKAIAMTKYLTKDPFRSLPKPELYNGQRKLNLELLDLSYSSIESSKRKELAKKLEEITLSKSKKIISCTSSYSDSINKSVKVHSNGFVGEKVTTGFYLGTDVTVDDGSGGRPEGSDYGYTRKFKDIPDLKIIADNAVKKAVNKIGQKKIESGKYEMVVENKAVSRLLRALLNAMNGSSLYRKSSFLDGKLGQKIGSDKLTIIDDPFIISAIGSRLYDGEGIAAKKRIMLEKGVLKEYYIDTYYGKKLEMTPTTGGNSNLVFDYGEKSVNELVKGIKKGILVNQFIGGNANGTTGDFSYGVVGQFVEDGKIIHPVNEMNLSGNMNDFWNKLIETGNDPFIYSSLRRPSMYFADVSFSGK